MSAYVATMESDVTDEEIIIPAGGKRIHVCIVGADNSQGRSDVVITVGSTQFNIGPGEKSKAIECATGDTDQAVTLTAPKGAAVDIHYDEV